MSDRILRALMQLFAIVRYRDDDAGLNSRNVVRLFLNQQLSQNFVEKYLQVFDEYLKTYQPHLGSEKQAKKTSLSSVKVLRICTEINKELNPKQKYVVLIRLIEYIYSSGIEVSDQSLEFTQTVAEIFNITPDEYKACLALVGEDSFSSADGELFLRVAPPPPKGGSFSPSNPDTAIALVFPPLGGGGAKYIHHPSLEGELLMVFMRPAGIFFFRYRGSEQLTLNGQPFSQKNIQVLAQGAVIRGSKTEAIYYSDAISLFIEQPLQERIHLDVRHLEFRFDNGQLGLHT